MKKLKQKILTPFSLKICGVLSFFILYSTILFAQQERITGIVQGQDGKHISGATIRIKGTNLTSTTNNDGEFQLEMNRAKEVLIVSYLGFDNQEVSFQDANSKTITLKPSQSNLEEVVVLGYGSSKREKVLGAVSQIGEEQFAIDLLPLLGRPFKERYPIYR